MNGSGTNLGTLAVLGSALWPHRAESLARVKVRSSAEALSDLSAYLRRSGRDATLREADNGRVTWVTISGAGPLLEGQVITVVPRMDDPEVLVVRREFRWFWRWGLRAYSVLLAVVGLSVTNALRMGWIAYWEGVRLTPAFVIATIILLSMGTAYALLPLGRAYLAVKDGVKLEAMVLRWAADRLAGAAPG